MNKDRIEKAVEEWVSPLSEYITVKIVRTQTQMRQKLPEITQQSKDVTSSWNNEIERPCNRLNVNYNRFFHDGRWEFLLLTPTDNVIMFLVRGFTGTIGLDVLRSYNYVKNSGKTTMMTFSKWRKVVE